MKKKVLALALSILSFNSIFALNSSASSVRDEAVAAQIQREIMKSKDERHKKINRKIKKIQNKISAKKAEIKRLEKVREKLDNELAIQYQLLEAVTSYYKIQSINREIRNIQSHIVANEKRIKEANKAISYLDHDLAIQYQLKENLK